MAVAQGRHHGDRARGGQAKLLHQHRLNLRVAIALDAVAAHKVLQVPLRVYAPRVGVGLSATAACGRGVKVQLGLHEGLAVAQHVVAHELLAVALEHELHGLHRALGRCLWGGGGV